MIFDSIRNESNQRFPTHLDPHFRKIDFHSELLPGVHVRIMRLLEGSLELVQLVGGEGRPVSAMLLLPAVSVQIVPAACPEFLVAATAGGVAAVLTWNPREWSGLLGNGRYG